MDSTYNKVSLGVGIPGILLQGYGAFLGPEGFLLQLIGTILLFIGLAYYAKGKGRSWAWCFLALLSVIGIVVLAFLKDKTKVLKAERKCPTCGKGVPEGFGFCGECGQSIATPNTTA